MSAIVELRDEVRELREQVKSMTNGNDIASNSIVRDRVDNTHKAVPIPVDPLIVLDGKRNGVNLRVLKDDGCNTNVVSKGFVKKFQHCLKVVDDNIMVQHSNKDSKERASQIVLNGTLKIGNHSYKSNWVVSNCRYDVVLGMPWHVAHNPNIDYSRAKYRSSASNEYNRRQYNCTSPIMHPMGLLTVSCPCTSFGIISPPGIL